MLRPPLRSRCRFRVFAIPLAAIWILLPAVKAEANIAPDAMVYFSIRPFGAPELLCETDIEDCSQMVASTPDQGPMEFQLFIDPQQQYNGAIPVTRFVADLSWPDDWELLGGNYCREADWWDFDCWGPGPHHLEIDWPCTVPDGMFLVMTLVFDVRGYGRFEPIGDCRLWLGCPPDDFVVYPTAQYAEAATACEYTDQPCATWRFRCVPHFAATELELSGVAGGYAHAEMDFTVSDIDPYCSGFHVNAEVPWITGHVEDGAHRWEFILLADADLTGLAPGTYQSELQVERGSSIARCLPVTVNVESTAGVEQPVAGSGSGGPLTLRMASANPCAGPFQLLFDNPWDAAVRCGVYDASGREIARLLEGEGPGADRAITWDARDAGGDPVRPGVYVIRLEAGGVVRSSRVVVVR